MLDSVQIQGRFVKDPELRKTNSGKDVTSFTLAVEHDKDNTSFIDCVAWDKTAQLITTHFTKGNMIVCWGALKTRTYEDSSGSKRKAVEVVLNGFSFCEKKDAGAAIPPVIDIPAAPAQIGNEEDLPF